MVHKLRSAHKELENLNPNPIENQRIHAVYYYLNPFINDIKYSNISLEGCDTLYILCLNARIFLTLNTIDILCL